MNKHWMGGAALLAVSAAVQAADLMPGLWEITMVTRVAGAEGYAPAPVSLSQCVTERDAQDPSRLIGGFSNPGATDCTYTEKSYSGSTFRFAMQCGGSLGLVSKGSVTFGPQQFNGNIDVSADLGGQSTAFRNQISGRRLGGC